MLSVATVNSTADTDARDASLTLREAIEYVDGTLALSSMSAQEQAQISTTQPLGTNDTIKFNIAGTGVQTIIPTVELPAITKAVTIDGYSQPGSSKAFSASTNGHTFSIPATIDVAINGSNTVARSGLTVQAKNVTIDGLMIYHFTGNAGGIGIDLAAGSGSDTIWGNYIGTDGTQELGNDTGIRIEPDSLNNTIGGATIAQRNVISGNYEIAGIDADFSSDVDFVVSDNVIEGNYIGTDATGTTAIANVYGIRLNNTSTVTIGGDTAGEGNLISGNTLGGIELYRAEYTTIEGNLIGTDASGKLALGNGGGGNSADGIAITKSFETTVGGTSAVDRNIISGSTGNGIDIDDSFDVNIEGNYIGTDSTGTQAIANQLDGVLVTDNSYFDIEIGGQAAGAGNVISGNTDNGIDVNGVATATIEGNFIGTTADGSAGLGNRVDGVAIQHGGFQVIVGGTTAAARNLISGNGNDGIEVIGGGTTGDSGSSVDEITEGNYIGSDISGYSAIGNLLAGVELDKGTTNNIVGGDTAGAGNLISGNVHYGVLILDPIQSGYNIPGYYHNVVEGNLIGENPIFNEPRGDDVAGVYIGNGASYNIIGGVTDLARNVIGSAAGVGVMIEGYGSGESGTGISTLPPTDNLIEGNYIGVDEKGDQQTYYPPPANPSGSGAGPSYDGDGIYVTGNATGTVIGGTTADARNVISGNVNNGIEIQASNTTVEGNYIGTDATGTFAIGNGVGVEVDQGTGSIIGGTTPAAANVISGNNGSGVVVYGNFSSGTAVEGNYIGTDATGANALGNKGDGVTFEFGGSGAMIGGSTAAAGNVIAYNAGAGVNVYSPDNEGSGGTWPTSDTIRLNSIYANGGLGIDLGGDGTTPNDPLDADTGSNHLQNFPILVSATSDGSTLNVAGTFNSLAGTNFTLDFYASNAVDTFGRGQGRLYLGSIGVITDSNGNATFSGTLNVAIGAYKYITATATNESNAPYGDTSEFSQAVEATGPGGSGPVVVPPKISIDDVVQEEGNPGQSTPFTFYLTRTGDLSAASLVSISTSGGTATAGSDYTALNGLQVAFAANQSTATVTVNVKGDSTTEGDETFNVIVTPVTNATIVSGGGLGTIIDDDLSSTPAPSSVAINDVSQKEGNSGTTEFVFTVTRSGDLSGTASVDYRTADGDGANGATSDSDYVYSRGEAIFAANQATATITIDVNGDTTVENDETFYVNLTGSANTSITDAQGLATILNDDGIAPPPAAPTIAINDVSQNEGNSGTTPFTFTLTRSGDLSSASSVNVSTSDGSATAGSDYTAFSNQLITFAANQATATVTVNVTGDTTVESNETFTVNVTAFSNATITDASGLGTIVNDDVATPVAPSLAINDVAQNEGNSGTTTFTFTVTRSGDLSGTSSVNFTTSDGSATGGSDYTNTVGTVNFAANQATATITIDVAGDTTVESNETFNVTLSAPTNATLSDATGVGTIINDDVAVPLPTLAINDVSQTEGNAGTTAYTFTVTRSGDLSGTSTVNYATADGTATAPADYSATSGTLTFAANQATATITVLVNGDTSVESNESFTINLTSPTNATISDGQGVGTIVNDDVTPPPVAPSVSINDVKQNEGNTGTTAFTFTLTRTGDLTNASTVSITTANGSATAGSDYTAISSQQIVFAANQATATVTVNVTGDKAVEADETFTVNVTAVTNATISDGQGLGTIVNDDAAPITIKAPSNLTGSVVSASQVSLKWKDNATNETGFEVQYSKSSNFSNATTVSLAGANITSASIAGLAANTTYYFRVRAVGPNSSASAYTSALKLTTKKAAAPAPVITGFNLINTDTDKVVMTLTDGMVIHKSSLPSLKNFSVQALVGGTVQSVKFSYKGTTSSQNIPPFSLFGDHGNGDYIGQTFATGSYTIVATPYSETGLKGVAGTPVTIHFTVVN